MKPIYTSITSIALVGCSVFASAQATPRLDVAQDVQATAVARIGRDMKIKGPWVQLEQGQTPQLVNLINGYDGTNVNPALMPGGAAFQDFYGPCSTTTNGLGFSWTYGPLANWPMTLNDIAVNPAASRKNAQIFRTMNRWNPAGTNPAGGTAPCFVAVFTGHGFNPVYDFMDDGYIIQFGAAAGLAGGYYRLTANFSGTNFSFPLPDASGGFVFVGIGTVDGGNNFVKLPSPGTASPGFHNVVDPSDPQFPGTNPSSSGPLSYLDNDASFTLDLATELYTFDQTATTRGWWSPSTAFFVDLDAPTISGTVTLEDLDPGTLRPVKSIRLVTTAAGDPNTVIKDNTVALGPAGEFEITAPTATGTYDIYAVPTHWLIRRAAGVSYTGSNVTGVSISCENGDADQDNNIGIGDYAILSAAYGADPSAGNWDVNADFNQDDIVDITDYAILSSNYGLDGD